MSESTSGIRDRTHAEALDGYRSALGRTTLAESSRTKYARRVAGYLDWLAATDIEGDPLNEPLPRTWAVRDYRLHLKRKRSSASTINGALTAIDDFYTRRGLGPANLEREDAAQRTAPKALTRAEAISYVRAVERATLGDRLRPRDVAIALTPYYAGLRIEEVVGLNVGDVGMSSRKGVLRVMGKGRNGGKPRDVPIKSELRTVLQAWQDARLTWPGADDTDALFLNRKGQRLSDRSAREVIVGFGRDARLGDDESFGPHVLRHTYATQLVRDGNDLVMVAELLGHSRLETTRIYTLPTAEEKAAAVERSIITDR